MSKIAIISKLTKVLALEDNVDKLKKDYYRFKESMTQTFVCTNSRLRPGGF